MRTLSILDVIYAQTTDAALLNLLTIDHDDLSVPVRVTDNRANVTSRGDVYTALGFTIALPAETEGELPQVRLTIDNVSQALVTEIRTLGSPLTVTVEVVVASDPDTVEVGPYQFTLRAVDYDQFVIEGTLGFEEDFLTEPFPARRFTPTDFPGLFNALS